MRVTAPAKINLFLTVGERRPDGLHEIESVMQAVSLEDVVSIEAGGAFTVDVSPPGAAPTDETNLALRAVRAFASAHGVEAPVRLSISKRIPMAAGLAGGSADAAATLVGLNRHWGVRASKKSLEKLGAGLGADVSFCVRGGTAVARGAGEILSALATAEPLWWVLGFSDVKLTTAEVYAAFDRNDVNEMKDPYPVADALARGDLRTLGAELRNDLEQAACSIAPSIASGRDEMLRAGALGVVMSGSGPTWCGLARDESRGRDVAERVATVFERVEVVRSLERGPKIVDD